MPRPAIRGREEGTFLLCVYIKQKCAVPSAKEPRLSECCVVAGTDFVANMAHASSLVGCGGRLCRSLKNGAWPGRLRARRRS